MKFLILVTLLFIPKLGNSQDLDNLDEKYGFNKFKLESSFENFKSDLIYLFTDDNVYKDGVKYYKYKKRDVSVFGYKNLNEVGLGFYKNKLYTINLDLGVVPDVEFSRIYLKLVDLFGEPNVSRHDFKDDYENRVQWSTNKTLLGFEKRKCNSNYNPCHLGIFLISLKMKNKILNDGF
jgi:hypothetical protein